MSHNFHAIYIFSMTFKRRDSCVTLHSCRLMQAFATFFTLSFVYSVHVCTATSGSGSEEERKITRPSPPHWGMRALDVLQATTATTRHVYWWAPARAEWNTHLKRFFHKRRCLIYSWASLKKKNKSSIRSRITHVAAIRSSAEQNEPWLVLWCSPGREGLCVFLHSSSSSASGTHIVFVVEVT